MKRFKLLLLIIAMAILSASAGIAVSNSIGCPFNFPKINPCDLVQYAPFQMNQGFENKQVVWFICTDVSDPQLAQQFQQGGVFEWGPNFAPRLANVVGQVPIVYVITNVQQGPVFTALPGDPNYSGVWQVIYVTFKPGVTKHCVNNAAPFDAVTNPTGLPSTADATFTVDNRAGNPVVVKYPIVAVGALGGPWFPVPAGRYRIPQGKVLCDYTYTKTIFLPFWQIYCQDPITRRVCVRDIAIPDACDPPGTPTDLQLVPKLGANDAPGLCILNDTQAFYWQLGPQPIDQFPILQACTTSSILKTVVWGPCLNTNLDYTPIETVVVLQRNVPPLPQSTVITNEPVLLDFILDGCLTPISSSQVIDGTVLPGAYAQASDP